MRKIDKLKQIERANILAEQRHIKSNSLVREDSGEMWSRDAAHRDTYSDTSYEDNRDNNPDEEGIHYGKAEFIIRKNSKNPKYNSYDLSTEDEGVIDSDRWSILKPEEEVKINTILSQGADEISGYEHYRSADFYKAIWKGKEVTVVVFPYQPSKNEFGN